MKKNIAFLLVLILIFSMITVIIINCTNINSKQSEKIEIIATLFPQYDFAKQIGGDKVNVTLLLPPGSESHTYEPTPQDMININNSSLFIYTGEEMEPWAENLIDGVKNDIKVLDLSTTVNLINVEEFEKEYCGEDCEHEHNHIYEHENDKQPENKNSHSYEVNNNVENEDMHANIIESHNHSYDPHIWLNPQYAIQIVNSISQQLCEIDPENKLYYQKNATEYIKQIQALDVEFEETVNASKNKKIAFGGAFAYAYFIEKYNLEFISAYQTCGENVEPSTTQVKEVIDYINKNKIPVIFYKEYTTGNIAKTISESTNAEMLVFHTVHNVSKEELENGASYISVMRQNLENLKKALN